MPTTPHPRLRAREIDQQAIGCPLCSSAWDCDACIASHLEVRHRTTYAKATHPVYPHPYTPPFCDPADCAGAA